MPSRVVTLAVVLFWLATLGWVVYRDRNREVHLPPLATFDLADEAGGFNNSGREIHWRVFFHDRRVGSCRTYPSRLPQQFFSVLCTYEMPHHEQLQFGSHDVHKLFFHSLVNLRGEQVALYVAVEREHGRQVSRAGLNATGYERTRSLIDKENTHKIDWESRDSLRAVVNPLHPAQHLNDLYSGQTWTATILDPLENARSGQPFHTVSWHARVSADELFWYNADTSCWRIDYADDAGATRSRIWARQTDGAVLRQEVHYPEGVLRLERKPGKQR